MRREQFFKVILGILAIMALTLILGSSAWAAEYKTLHKFQQTGVGGSAPYAGLTFDAAGNLYGTTITGGTGSACIPDPCGAVFKLTPNGDGSWTESVLHWFNGSDGLGPFAGLIFDAAGNLYGTTEYGGSGSACGTLGCGTVFELTPNGDGSWTESVLHSFNGSDGAYPYSSLIFDAAGNLFGTTALGGSGSACGPDGCGTVFKLTPNGDGSWTESVLNSFNGGDGSNPWVWPDLRRSR